MNKSLIKYLGVALFILSFTNINSQTCGFGCLGLSGVYGGYSIQQYEADGLNEYLGNTSNNIFKGGRGFKVGINLVRAEYVNYFFTFKGYYQFLSESKTITNSDAKLEMNNWGVGLDFGIPICSFVDWKIIDGELKFFSPKLILKSNDVNPLNNIMINEKKYTPDKVKMGYSIGSGFIFNIVKDYVSIEVTGMYTFVELDYLTNDSDGSQIPKVDSDLMLISKGGFQGIVQLNVGLPF
jgi:hypothetical protein